MAPRGPLFFGLHVVRWRLVRHSWILGKLWGMHHERGWVVSQMTSVVRVSLGRARGGLLLLLLDDLLCFVGGHGYLML